MLHWSEGRNIAAVTQNTVDGWTDNLPELTDSQQITVLETWVEYDPPFNTGLSERTVRNFIFTRPRYGNCTTFEGSSFPDADQCVLGNG